MNERSGLKGHRTLANARYATGQMMSAGKVRLEQFFMANNAFNLFFLVGFMLLVRKITRVPLAKRSEWDC